MGRSPIPYYERPKVPWCVIGKVSWGVVQAVKVPEDIVHLYTGVHGWKVLIRDSEFPVPVDDAGTMPQILSASVPSQSNPRRRVDVDHWREDGA